MPPTYYHVPIIQVFGQNEISGFFQNVYAVLTPAMPFLMIALATALAGYMISTIRKVFTFDSIRGKDDYGYKDEKRNRDDD